MYLEVGKVWFTVWTEVYNGSNEPTAWDNIIKIGSIVVGTGVAVGTFGAGTVAFYGGSLVIVGAYAGASTCVAVGTTILIGGLAVAIATPTMSAAIYTCCQPVSKKGVYANGQTLYIRGLAGRNPEDPNDWVPMRIDE